MIFYASALLLKPKIPSESQSTILKPICQLATQVYLAYGTTTVNAVADL